MRKRYPRCRYFGEKHRVFGRYTFFRDNDTPVTPLPDGSGSLTSGAISHAITRGDAFAGDYKRAHRASYRAEPQLRPMGPALLTKVANPYFGQVPASSSLGGATIAQQLLLRPYPRFTTVALFRDNVGNSSYEAAAVKLEKRLSHGLTVNAAYTFSKLLDDASSVFSQTIFTGPVLNSPGAADAYNRHLEKDVSSGDIPQVFALGWICDIPRLWKISGWRIAGLVACRRATRWR